MIITKVEIENFRALKSITFSLSSLSILIGENDAGKTSVLHALDKFFLNKKLSEEEDWFKHDPSAPISITLTFNGIPADQLGDIARADGSVIVRKTFKHDKPPQTKAQLDDGTWTDVPKGTLEQWFSSERYHFIPVRRDLAVQFSMNKTALLGKTLRARMAAKLAEDGAVESLDALTGC